jgi:hypothetical protein
MTIGPVTYVRLVGIVLAIVFLSHFVKELPWLVIGGAAIALLFVPWGV